MKRNTKIALEVFGIVLSIGLIVFVVNPWIRSQSPMQKALESCEKTVTIGA